MKSLVAQDCGARRVHRGGGVEPKKARRGPGNITGKRHCLISPASCSSGCGPGHRHHSTLRLFRSYYYHLIVKGRCGLAATGAARCSRRCPNYLRSERVVQIARLDHLVLTVADIARTCLFLHAGAPGMEVVTFGEGRTAAALPGQQKINLHRGRRHPGPGRRQTHTGLGRPLLHHRDADRPASSSTSLPAAVSKIIAGPGRAPVRSARSRVGVFP